MLYIPGWVKFVRLYIGEFPVLISVPLLYRLIVPVPLISIPLRLMIVFCGIVMFDLVLFWYVCTALFDLLIVNV